MKKKDEGFTSIRIRETTREALRAIGTYNDNMDSIVMKCIDAYKQLSSVSTTKPTLTQEQPPMKQQEEPGVMYGAMYEVDPQSKMRRQVTPERAQEIRQLQSQQTIKQSSIFTHDNIVPTLEEGQYEVVLWMPGLTFPTNKDIMLQYAKTHDQSDSYKYERKLAPIIYQILSHTNTKKTFGNVSVLEDEVIEYFKIKEGIGEFGEFREEKRFQLIKDCKIIVDEDKNVYLNYLHSLHERMKALGKDSDTILHQDKELSEFLLRLNVI